MKISVSTEEDVFPLEVSLELTLLDLKAILEIELSMSASQMVLLHNMAPMTEEGRNLGDYHVEDGDVIVLRTPPPAEEESVQNPPLTQPPSNEETPLPPINWGDVQIPGSLQPPTSQPHTGQGASLPDIDWGAIQVPGHTPAAPPRQQEDPNDPEVVRRHFLSHPNELAMLRQQNPPLAAALESGDMEEFRKVLSRHTQAVREVERQRIRMLNADPFDLENQTKIAQDIQQKNIEENMQAAIEYTPESFSNITMLYLPIKVNGVIVKALVDSGAGGTIMSDKCAERCGVMRLVDRRFAGMAIGIGTQKIIGKVHLGTIQIGEDFLTSSFKVLADQSEDMLLGLDMLRRHQVRAHLCIVKRFVDTESQSVLYLGVSVEIRMSFLGLADQCSSVNARQCHVWSKGSILLQCCIDLKKNVLRVGTTGNETPFLTEADLKDKEETRRQQAVSITFPLAPC